MSTQSRTVPCEETPGTGRSGVVLANCPAKMRKAPDARDGTWSRYPETILKFATDPAIDVDLRAPVSPPTRDALRAIGLGRQFAVLTAYNPRGENVSSNLNHDRSKELEAELRSIGEKFVRVDACSPDESHCECGVAVSSTWDRAIATAKRFEQVAIFWFDGSQFWIVGVVTPAQPMKLPVGR